MGNHLHTGKYRNEVVRQGESVVKQVIVKSVAATSVILGTFVPQVLANTTTSARPEMALVQVDGTTLNKPYIVVRSDSGVPTTYVPMFYVNQALAKAGYKATWNGNTHTWALTTSLTNLDYSNVSLGTGNTTITINGQAIKKINTFAQHDPATSKNAGDTVYIPIYYVDVLFNAAGISGMWDGSRHAWTLTTPVNLQMNTTYGPTTGVQTVKKNINVLGTNVTVQNMAVTGNVYLNPGANGDVYLKNVKVTGAIVVLSGAPHSIHLSNVSAPQLVINSTSAVHVVSEGATSISSTQVGAADKESVTLEQQSGSLGNVTLGAKQAVTLTGPQPFTNVQVQGTGSLIVDNGASVKTLSVTVSSAHVTISTGANVATVSVGSVTGVTLDNEGTISTLQNQAPSTGGVTVTGQGTITQTTGTVPTDGDSGQTSNGGGGVLPPAPTSSVSVVSMTPKPGTNLNGATSVDFSVVINYTSVIDNGTVTAELGKESGQALSLGEIPVQKGSGQVTITKTGVSATDLTSFIDASHKVYLAIGLKDSSGNYDGTWHQLTQYSYDLSTPVAGLPSLTAPSPQVSGMKVTWRGSKFASGYLVKVYSGTTVVDQIAASTTSSVDLSKRNLPKATYTVTVIAEGDNVNYSSSPESAPVTVSLNSLNAPANVQTDVNASLVVDWGAVTSATGYLIRVYDQAGQDLLMSNGTDANTRSQNIAALGLPAGQYQVAVVAEGDGVTMADSVESTRTNITIVALPQPVPTISTMTVSWAKVTGATGYDVYVHDSTGLVIDKEPVDSTKTSFDLSKPGYPAGPYIVGVVAKGDNMNTIDSAEGMAAGTVALNPVPTPTNLVTAGTDVMWDPVGNATGYQVALLDSSGDVIDVSQVLPPSTTDFDVATGFSTEYASGDYVEVMAEGDGTTTSNSMSSAMILVNPLETPTNVSPVGTDLMWDAVPNATGYEVVLLDANQSNIIDQVGVDSSTTDFDLKNFTGYQAGDYAFVYAIGDGTLYSDSADSPAVLVNPLAPPANLAINGTIVAWTGDPNATGYTVEVFDSSNNLVGKPTLVAADSIDLSTLNLQSGTYTISVFANGGTANYTDSDASTGLTVTI